MINIKTSKSNILTFIIVMAFIFQGCYFPIEYSLVLASFLLIGAFTLYKSRLLIDKNFTYLFLIILISYLLPIFSLNSDLYTVTSEQIRLLLIGLIPIIFANDSSKHNLLNGVYIGASAVSFLGLMAYFKLITFTDWVFLDGGLLRLQSTLQYANTTAIISAIGGILAIYHRSKSKKSIHSWLLYINIIATILTFSKIGFFCIFIAIICMAIIKYPNITKRIAIFGLPLLLIASIILYIKGKFNFLQGSTLAWRIIYWQDGLKLIAKNPFGIGVGGWEQQQYSVQGADYSVKLVHNGFLQIALDGGIIALLAFISILILSYIGLFKNYKNTKDLLYIYLLGILTLIIAHSFFDIDLSFGAILIILGVILAYSLKPKTEFKFTPIMLIISLLLIITSLYFATTEIVNNSKQQNIQTQYQTLTQKYSKNPNDVPTLSKLYSIAYSMDKSEDMYKWSSEWLRLAPRQKSAYEAHFVSIDRMITTTNNEKYKKEKEKLYEQANKLNRSVVLPK